MKVIALVVLASFLLVGCVVMPTAGPPAIAAMAFDKSEHGSYFGTGAGAVRGQAFLRQQGGGVVTCAGSRVLLVPATTYFDAAIAAFRSGHGLSVVDQEAVPLIRATQCDAQGNFNIAGVPSGRYFVGTQVRWTVGYYSQGGDLGRVITVDNLGPVEVLLTDSDRI